MGHYTLRTVLIGFFVLQVTATTLVVTYLALRNGQDAVDTLVTQLLTEMHHRVQERIQTFAREAYKANAANREELRAGHLALGEHDCWLAHVWRQKDQFPTLSYLTVADEKGEWVGLRMHGKLMTEATDGAKGLTTYAVSATGERADQIKHIDGYDATTRDWYRLPRELRRPVWTPIYIWAGTQVLSMTLSEPLLDHQGNFIGLVAADLTLAEIRDFLLTLQVGKTGRAFLLERNGNLIAASAKPQPFVRSPDGSSHRIRGADYADATVARASTNLAQQFGTLAKIRGHQQRKFGQGRSAEQILVAPFGGPFGLDWLLVIVVPESDFMDEIYAGTRQTVLICMGILVLTILFGFVYSARLSKPIRSLTEQVRHVQAFKLDNTFDVGPAVAEVHTLAGALACMQAGLSSFRRFVPADLVRRILDLGEEACLGGEVRDVTILFSDLRGYSTLTEKLTPEMLITFMNLYFQTMEDVITKYGGVIIELQGDGILAVFGAPDTLANHVSAAAHCAIAMRDQLEALDTRLQQTRYTELGGFNGTLELFHRIGIHTGPVLAGNIGGQSYMKYGVIGDVVNVASRLEQLNKHYHTSLLISSEVYGLLPTELRVGAENHGKIRLKGREQPQHVYSL